MTLLFIDGFDHYNTNNLGTTTNMDFKWDTTPTNSTSMVTNSIYSRSSGTYQQGLKINHSETGFESTQIAKAVTPSSTLIWGAAIAILGTTPPRSGDNNHNLTGTRAAGSYGIGIILNADYTLSVIENELGTILGTTDASIIPSVDTDNIIWYYMEVKVFMSETVGTVEIRMEGLPWLELTGLDTTNGGSSDLAIVVGFDTVGEFTSLILDDVYICNDQGSLNNGFLGDVHIDTIYPDATGTYSEWTASSPLGYNWGNVSEKNDIDEDGTYNESTATDDMDSYNLGSTSWMDDTLINAIAVNTTGRNTGSDIQIFPFIIVDSTEYEYTGLQVSADTAYHLIQSIIEENPDTTTTWTMSDIDSMETGVRDN